ncbi:hypothetical protein INR49_004517, partial [Caranx melampygus]
MKLESVALFHGCSSAMVLTAGPKPVDLPTPTPGPEAFSWYKCKAFWGPGSPQRAAGVAGELAVEEMAERLTQTEQLVTQLKEMIREKDAALRTKDEQLK